MLILGDLCQLLFRKKPCLLAGGQIAVGLLQSLTKGIHLFLQILTEQAVGVVTEAGILQLPFQLCLAAAQLFQQFFLLALLLRHITDDILFPETADQCGMKITVFHRRPSSLCKT